jgi:ubiquinone/menaquinone biosynthesis C-methylase UbiE
MKFRESGMPEEKMWNIFFEPKEIFEKMEIKSGINSLINIGCGYGTFLIPVSKLTKGKVTGIDIDIEKGMIDLPLYHYGIIFSK